jgi:hypothetical protein
VSAAILGEWPGVGAKPVPGEEFEPVEVFAKK